MRLRFGSPACAALALLASCHGSRGGSAVQGTLAISHAVVPVPASTAEGTVFFVIENRGPAPVTLVGAQSPQAASTRIDRDIGGQMQPVAQLEIPAGGRERLVPGGYHLMLVGMPRALAAGDTVSLTLLFQPGGGVTVKAPVLTYTDAISELPER